MSKVSILRGVKMGEVKNEVSEVSGVCDMACKREPKQWTESQQYLNRQRIESRCQIQPIR